MYIFDGRITIEEKELLDEYLNGFEYKTSGLSYSSMYMWRNINEFSWKIIGDYMCITGISHLELEQGIVLPFMFAYAYYLNGKMRRAFRQNRVKIAEINGQIEDSHHPQEHCQHGNNPSKNRAINKKL